MEKKIWREVDRKIRCNIVTCTVFHHSIHANVNTYPIPVHPLGCVVHAKMMYHVNTHLCTPLMCTGKWWRIKMLYRNSFSEQENIDTNICSSISKCHTPKTSIEEKNNEGFTRWPGCEGWREYLCPGASTKFLHPHYLWVQKFKQILLQKVRFECPHHLMVSPPVNLHS